MREAIWLAGDVGVGDAADDRLVIAGTGLPIGDVAELYPGHTLEFAPGAFKGAFDDVVLNAYRHQSEPMARTSAGNLELEERSKGVHYAAVVDQSDHGFMDLYRRVKNGVVDKASLGFLPSDSEFEVDAKTGDVAELVKLVDHVFEVTLVAKPIFSNTSARAMSRELEYDRKPFAGVPEEVLAERERVLSKTRMRKPDLSKRARAVRPVFPDHLA